MQSPPKPPPPPPPTGVAPPPRLRIGELLISAGVLTDVQLEEALQKPRTEGERIGDVLVRLGFVTETQLTQTLSQQLSVPWVSLYHVEFSRQLLNLVPEELAEMHCLVPVFVRNGPNAGRGNAALLHRGGKPWPNPRTASELGSVLVTAAESVASGPRQEALPLALHEVARTGEAPRPAHPAGPGIETPEPVTARPSVSPGAELLERVRAILEWELASPRSVAEVAELLAVTRPQAKAWLGRLVETASLEKVPKSRPARYQTTRRLL